jgi:hypothetical protein
MENKLEIVKQLNAELHERFGEQEYSFGYSTDGYCEMIDFGNMPIWNSEMDGREWDEEKNEYEPFEPYIKKEFDKLVDKLFSLNFGIVSAPPSPIVEAAKSQKRLFTAQELVNHHIQIMKIGLIEEGEKKWEDGYEPKIREIAEKYISELKG